MSEGLSDEARRRLLAAAQPLLDETSGEGRVQGRYRLTRELGRGGMGVVWEAHDEELGRKVALKLLHLVPGASPEMRERFLRESRAAARLSHPGIAAIFDADERLIAMQLVDGSPLSNVPAPGLQEAARWIRDAALAVHYAHEQGIIHRDIKPHNLLLEGERVLVTDFGLAKDALAASELSHSGSLLGTPAYMAPEQARGGGTAIDARTDVWGLGATLYDLVCGRPPFVGADVVEVLRRIDEDTPPAPGTLQPGLPRDLELVLLKALEKEPSRRYATARDLADDLHRWLDGRPVLARAPTWSYRVAKFAARHRLALALAATSVIALAVALGTQLARRAAARASDSALELSNRVSAVLDDVEKFRREGEIELANDSLDQAIRVARDLVAKHDIASGHFLLGRLLVSREQRSEARNSFDRALELRPDMIEARVARGLLIAREVAQSIVRGGWSLGAGTGDLPGPLIESRDGALADLAALGDGDAVLSLIDRLKVKAEVAHLSGRLQEADELWAQVLHRDEVSADAKIARSHIANQRGDGDAAWALAMSAIDMHRGLGPAYVARGRIGPPHVAMVDVAPLLAAHPSDALAHAQRGQVHVRRATRLASEDRAQQALLAWADAIEQFDNALVIEPTLTAALNNRGVARVERERLLQELGREEAAQLERQLALQDFDRALDLAPRLPQARLNRALVRVRLAERARAAGRKEEGAELVEAARVDLVSALGLVTSDQMRRRLQRELDSLAEPGAGPGAEPGSKP